MGTEKELKHGCLHQHKGDVGRMSGTGEPSQKMHGDRDSFSAGHEFISLCLGLFVKKNK